jgi:hypothetical protein
MAKGKVGAAITVAREKAAPFARRAGKAAAGAVRDEKHTLTALATAGVNGWMRGKGYAPPHIEALGVEGTYGIAAWAIGKKFKSPVAAHMATALLSIALDRKAEAWARTPSSSTPTPTPTPGGPARGAEDYEVTY